MEGVISFDLEMLVDSPQFDLEFEAARLIYEKDYERLDNKPQINDVTLIGNKTGSQLHLMDHMDSISNMEIEELLAAFV